ncbi:MAG: hypothetical protein H6865_07460 [Rhodospirillales bacterium]|nr:hypothetical protein [Alphaproteobacteria bacterium]MCB9987451.1 hypothetical protein [Rhodospirillales bacterium]USO07570.1 MAG: hypothetical protein H6866_09195 [Rhodospirillales bacterium]
MRKLFQSIARRVSWHQVREFGVQFPSGTQADVAFLLGKTSPENAQVFERFLADAFNKKLDFFDFQFRGMHLAMIFRDAQTSPCGALRRGRFRSTRTFGSGHGLKMTGQT